MLKDRVGGTKSILTIPSIENSSNGWTATINFQMGSYGGRTFPPADGFSFNYNSLSYLDQLGENSFIGEGEFSPLDGGMSGRVFETGLYFGLKTWPNSGTNGFHIQYAEEVGEA